VTEGRVTRVVKLSRLADLEAARAEDQNLLVPAHHQEDDRHKIQRSDKAQHEKRSL
jgi:hypothetical protein